MGEMPQTFQFIDYHEHFRKDVKMLITQPRKFLSLNYPCEIDCIRVKENF